jgi:hypothetical protein
VQFRPIVFHIVEFPTTRIEIVAIPAATVILPAAEIIGIVATPAYELPLAIPHRTVSLMLPKDRPSPGDVVIAT